MLRKLYIGAGAGMILAYLTWSALGWELFSQHRDSIPNYVRSSSTSGSRSRGVYFGSGYGWGK